MNYSIISKTEKENTTIVHVTTGDVSSVINEDNSIFSAGDYKVDVLEGLASTITKLGELDPKWEEKFTFHAVAI